MGKYLKSEKANACREEIYAQVEPYVLENGEMRSNSGQLKFLKGLMIRNLAVSSRVRVRKEGFLKYLRESMRLCNNDEVIAFMDCEKNLEAFLHSPYCEEFYYDKMYKQKYGFLPFLLLQRTQAEMERAMLRYLSLSSGLEAYDEKKGEEMEQHKLEAYVEWLYSIALYEIFLRNCFDDIERDFWEKRKDMKASDEGMELMRRFNELCGCKDLNKRKELAKEMAGYTAAYLDELWQQVFDIYYINFFIQHLTNLYAVLRIVVLIEYVNINLSREEGGIRKKKDIEAFEDAAYWKNLVQEWIDRNEFFAEVGRNRNLNVLYNELNKVYWNCQIFSGPSRKNGEEKFWERAEKPISDIKQYLGVIRAHTADKRPPEEEKKLWNIETSLSVPIWNAVHEISEITVNAEKAREKNRSRSHAF